MHLLWVVFERSGLRLQVNNEPVKIERLRKILHTRELGEIHIQVLWCIARHKYYPSVPGDVLNISNELTRRDGARYTPVRNQNIRGEFETTLSRLIGIVETPNSEALAFEQVP
jgi:hypothetical protein